MCSYCAAKHTSRDHSLSASIVIPTREWYPIHTTTKTAPRLNSPKEGNTAYTTMGRKETTGSLQLYALYWSLLDDPSHSGLPSCVLVSRYTCCILPGRSPPPQPGASTTAYCSTHMSTRTIAEATWSCELERAVEPQASNPFKCHCGALLLPTESQRASWRRTRVSERCSSRITFLYKPCVWLFSQRCQRG